jgi:cytochrome b561
MIRDTVRSWGLVSALFHWVMAVLFIGQFGLGWYMLGIADMMRQYDLFQWHKSFGFLILGLAVLRSLWTLSSRRPALPEAMAEGEKRLALGAHVVLYAMLLVIPLTGWAVVSTSPLPVATWFFKLFVVPPLPLGVSRSAEQIWGSFHSLLAYSAMFLVGVHILAALRHHFHHKDHILRRMIRPGSE